jgi:hypothetical protein
MDWQVFSLACFGPIYLVAALLALVWNWEAFYLICFLVGFVLAVISFLSGALHLHLPTKLHLHLDHLDGGHGHGGGVHDAGGHVHTAAGHAAGHAHGPGEHGASFFNTFSLMAFLAWFGGTGYLLTRAHSMIALIIFVVSGLAGLLGATVVFLFLARVLMAHDRPLDSADFDMIGVLGRVNSAVHAGGTGEIVFELAGTRHSAAARSEDGSAMPKGIEVVVTRYENGIAYVRAWDEMSGEEQWTIRSDQQ